MLLEKLRENLALRPFMYTMSLLYGGMVGLRNFLFDKGVFKPVVFSKPVISIGNISAGGTGKTPMTLYLLDLLKDKFDTIAVVSRGYRRKTTGVLVVSDGRGNVVDAVAGGDEPVLIAKKFPCCPVVVAEKRRLGIETAINQYKADIILLDDAFQHRWVARDFDIVVHAPRRQLGQERLLPLGNLRESLDGLSRADIVIQTKKGRNEALDQYNDIMDYFNGAVYNGDLLAAGLVNARFQKTIPLTESNIDPVFAFAAIADSRSFERILADIGITVKAYMNFPDHHYYTASDISRIKQSAQRLNCRHLLTTEKDLIKLINVDFMGFKLSAVSLKMVIKEREMLLQKLMQHIDNRIIND